MSPFGSSEYTQAWDAFNDYVEDQAQHGRNDQTDPEYQRLSTAVDDAAARAPWWQR